ncbi:MAG: hypothetical protein GX846_00100, partial [Deltaproteobacteria bacterium]|nr:hypothetical protein [Deltaproteobacteria bacterium]
MNKTLKIGAGREIITPPLGMILSGYAPGRPAVSINDDLRVTCLALADGQTKAMLISADICTYQKESSDRLRSLVADQVGVPAANVIFSPTHTHSGPVTSSGWIKTGGQHLSYIEEIFEPAVQKAAKAAWASLEPAHMGIGTVQS